MKKIVLLIFLNFALFANIGKVITVKGEPTLLRNGTTHTLNIGAQLLPHDTLKTDNKSKLQLVFQDGTIITIGKNSSLNIDEYKFNKKEKDTNKAKFSTSSGLILLTTGQIGKLNRDQFKLKAKTATMGIRGTVFAVKMNGDTTYSGCTQGGINSASNDNNGDIDVPAGKMTSITKGEKPTLLKDYDPNLFSDREHFFVEDRGEYIYPAILQIDEMISVGRYEVTNEEYVRFLNSVGRFDSVWMELSARDRHGRIFEQGGKYYIKKGYENHPVSEVSWFGALAFTHWLSQKTGVKFRLPTDKEWEKIATNYKKERKYLSILENSNEDTTPIGRNEGYNSIYDLYGNVWEWISDINPDRSEYRLLRGGSWYDDYKTISKRDKWESLATSTFANFGFRVVRDDSETNSSKSLDSKSDRCKNPLPNRVKSYYQENSLMSDIPYKNCMKNGEAYWYYPSGAIEYIIHYIDDEIVGEVQYFEDIKMIQSEFHEDYDLPKFIFINCGTYMMGDLLGNEYADEKPVHKVTLDYDFYVAENEVTFREYDKFCKNTNRARPSDSGFGRDEKPVINVTYDDAVAYTKWISKKSGKKIRLLSESEWEYVARAGGTAHFYDSTYMWNFENSDQKTHNVREKKPNSFHIYDMIGNVNEWVLDWYSNSYVGAPNDGGPNMIQDVERVARGCSWNDNDAMCYISNRFPHIEITQTPYLGFRLLLEID